MANIPGLPAALRSYIVDLLPVLGSTRYRRDMEDPMAGGFGGCEQPLLECAQHVRKTASVLNDAVRSGLPVQIASAIYRYVAGGGATAHAPFETRARRHD